LIRNKCNLIAKDSGYLASTTISSAMLLVDAMTDNTHGAYSPIYSPVVQVVQVFLVVLVFLLVQRYLVVPMALAVLVGPANIV
jgi:hypothetical protein